jgi:hypothetical protein
MVSIIGKMLCRLLTEIRSYTTCPDVSFNEILEFSTAEWQLLYQAQAQRRTFFPFSGTTTLLLLGS